MTLDAILYYLENELLDDGLRHIQSKEDKSSLVLALKSIILERLNQFDEAETAAINARRGANTEIEQLASKAALILVYIRTSRYEEAEALITQIDTSINPPENDMEYNIFWCKYLTSKGYLFHIQGNLSEAFHAHSQALNVGKTTNYRHLVRTAYRNLGEVTLDQGEYEKAINYFKILLELSQDAELPLDTGYAHRNLGQAYLHMGNFGHAQTHLLQATNYFQKIGQEPSLILTHLYLAKLRLIILDFNQAANDVQIADSLAETLDNAFYHAMCKHYLGKVRDSKAYYKQAEDAFLQSLEIWKSLGNLPKMALVYYDLIDSILKTEDVTKAKYYLDLFEADLHQNEQEFFSTQYNLCKVKVLLATPRIAAIAKAQTILLEIKEHNIEDYEIYVEILVSLIYIKLYDLKLFPNKEIAEELEELLSDLHKTVNQKPFLPAKIEIMFLMSRMAILKNDFNMAVTMLESTRDIASSLGLTYFINRIDKEKEEIQKKILKIKDFTDDSTTLSEILNEVDIENYLSDISLLIRNFAD